MSVRFRFGGESRKVDEHCAVVIFELEAYPEPKVLSVRDLEGLMRVFGSTVKVAKYIGASQAFVWGQLKSTKRRR